MRRLLTSLVVLLVLLVAADRLTSLYAEHRVATSLRDTETLGSTPSVHIHGFPFLTQLFRGHYDDVQVVAHDFTRADVVRIDSVDVHLHGVKLPLSDALSGSAKRVPVDHVDGVAVIAYSSLDRAHDGLTFSYAGTGRIKVTGGVSVLGQSVQAAATGRISLHGDAFVVSVDSVSVGGAQAPQAVTSVVSGAFGVTTSLPTLPFHFTLKSVRATARGIEIGGSADDIVLETGGR